MAITWENARRLARFASFEDPVSAATVPKQEFESVYGPFLETLDGLDGASFIDFFFAETPLVQGKWEFIDDNAREDFFEGCKEMGCMPTMKEICEGEDECDRAHRFEKEEVEQNCERARRFTQTSTVVKPFPDVMEAHTLKAVASLVSKSKSKSKSKSPAATQPVASPKPTKPAKPTKPTTVATTATAATAATAATEALRSPESKQAASRNHRRKHGTKKFTQSLLQSDHRDRLITELGEIEERLKKTALLSPDEVGKLEKSRSLIIASLENSA